MPHRFRTLMLATALLLPIGIARADYQTYDEALVAARALFEKGDYEAAQKELEAGLPLAKTVGDKIGAFQRLGETYKRRKLYPQARKEWNKILQLPGASGDNKATTRFLIASSYGDENRWDEAKTELQKAVNTPDIELNTEYSVRLGLFAAYNNSGNPDALDRAREQIYSIIDDPRFDAINQVNAALLLGDTLKAKKKFDDARAAYNAVDNINGVPDALWLQAKLGLAQCYKQEGKSDEAFPIFSEAFTFGLTKGAKLFKADKFEESNVLLKLILSLENLEPTEKAGTYFFIGANYMGLKEWQKALDTLSEAAKEPAPAELARLSPNRLQAFYKYQTGARIRIARILVGSEMKDAATKSIKELLESPNSVLEPNERAQLEQMLKSVS